jgi:hypothetical protein
VTPADRGHRRRLPTAPTWTSWRFWELAAGWTRRGVADGRVMLRSPRDVGPFLELQRFPEVKIVKNRLHLDMAPEKGEGQAAAVRLPRGRRGAGRHRQVT